MAAGQKNDPHTRLARLERWSGRATLLILAGIIIEIVLVLWFAHEFWERNWSIVANALIGIGLIAEYIVIGRTIVASGEAQLESDAKLAEALNRAANAEEQLARLRTPRREILKEKGSLITEAAKPFTGTVFDTGSGPMDQDVGDCLWDLEPLLWAAGWEQIDWTLPTLMKSGVRRGPWPDRRTIGVDLAVSNIAVHIHPGSEKSLGPAADALVAALNEIGLAAKRDPFNIHNVNNNAMHILVGPIR